MTTIDTSREAITPERDDCFTRVAAALENEGFLHAIFFAADATEVFCGGLGAYEVKDVVFVVGDDGVTVRGRSTRDQMAHCDALLDRAEKAEAERDALKAERDGLREAAKAALIAVESARRVETGAGGMTIESQLMRSVYHGVPAWPFEELRAALGDA